MYIKKQNKNYLSITFLMLSVIFLCALSPLSIYAEDSYASASIASWPTPPEIDGAAAILMDAESGAILYSKNAQDILYPASITKIMTGLLSMEHLNMNDTITYNDQILNQLPSDAAKLGLVSGETTTIKDALYALLLRSANEVAIGLAIEVSGSEEAFAELMTQRAADAGALNTHFANASGLHDENHYTTAYDMAMIAKAAMSNSEFSTIWGSENYTLSPTNMSEGYRIWHRHALLLSNSPNYYAYAIGGKTGYTDEAGRTLVTAAQKDGLTLICVIMKSDDEHIFSDTSSLFDYGFNHFTKVNIGESETRFGSGSEGIPIINKLYGTDSGIFSLSNDPVLIPSGVSLSEIPYQLDFFDTPQNNVVATITYSYEGNYLGKASLMMNLSNNSQSSLSGPQKNDTVKDSVAEIKETTSINIYLLAGSIIAVIIIVFVLIKIFLFSRRVSRHKKRWNYK